MSIYGNEYELYYRNLKNRNTGDKLVRDNRVRKTKDKAKKGIGSIIIYDLCLSVIFLLAMFTLKYVNSESSEYMYSRVKTEFTKQDKTLNYYNDAMVNQIQKVYTSVFESNSNGEKVNE